MRARPRPHPSSRPVVVALASLLVAGMLSVGPARAHSFTKTDGNDVPGKLDIRTSTVGHSSNSIVFKIRTYQTWTPSSLQDDSFLLVQIDRDNDRNYERCAVIFFASRLRSVLTNCGQNVIQNLPVGKPNGTTVRTTIPKSQTGLVHWWATATYWEGASPCVNGCVDFVPNLFPDILHDLQPPTITMATSALEIWETSPTTSFRFPFTVTDPHSGVGSWTVQRRPLGGGTWSNVISGTSGGAKNPLINGQEGTQLAYRVVAKDRHGNQRIGPTRRVYVPTDVDTISGPGDFSGTGVDTAHVDAFMGAFVALDDPGTDVYTIDYEHPGGPCRRFELIGPGTGDWGVSASGPDGTTGINAAFFEDDHRQVLWSESACADATWTFTLNFGSGFGVDAVLT